MLSLAPWISLLWNSLQMLILVYLHDQLDWFLLLPSTELKVFLCASAYLPHMPLFISFFRCKLPEGRDSFILFNFVSPEFITVPGTWWNFNKSLLTEWMNANHRSHWKSLWGEWFSRLHLHSTKILPGAVLNCCSKKWKWSFSSPENTDKKEQRTNQN